MDRAERAFDGELSEVRAARHFARAVTARWGCPSEDLVLVVDELASNAVCHGGSPFRLSLQRHGASVVVEVTDASPGLPQVQEPELARGGGRGLIIVGRLAAAWGTRPGPDGGKTVWVDLPLSSSRPP